MRLDTKTTTKVPVLSGVSLLSAAVLVLEISMTRIFSFALWYHYAFMIISVALLGFGMSGVVLTVSRRLTAADYRRVAVVSSAMFAVTAAAGLLTVTVVPFDPAKVTQGWIYILPLALDFMILTLPFFFAGLTMAKVMAGLADEAHRVYFADLAGGGAGCIAAIGLFSLLGGPGMVFLAAALALGAATLFGLVIRFRAAVIAAAGCLAAIGLAIGASGFIAIPTLAEKLFARCLDKEQFPNSRLAYTGWNVYSRIDVLEGCEIVRWLFNPAFPAYLPPNTQIVIDGDATTTIAEYSGNPAQLGYLAYIPSALPYTWLRPPRSLIIGSGGGNDVYSALLGGSRQVDAVEINPLITRLMTGPYAKQSGNVYRQPGVSLYVDEGRNFIRNRKEPYDLIQLTLIDTWAALSSGAYSLSESYLYTVEAFEDYLRHLSPGGAVAITRWMWDPPKEALRLCAVAMEAMSRMGIADPARHIAVFSMGGVGTVVFGRSAFTSAQLQSLEDLCARRRFQVLYLPQSSHGSLFDDLIMAPNRQAFLRAYPFDISPVTDDRPFFFLFNRWRDLNPFTAFQDSMMTSIPGKLVLLIVLALSTILAMALILLPLAMAQGQRLRGLPKAPFLIYFFGIGMAFMLVEIYLMQTFTLFLGHPIYSLALVLMGLLLSSGAGSLFSRRLIGEASPARLGTAVVLLTTLILTFALFHQVLFAALLGTPLAVRATITLVLIVPLGFLMGLPFPTGIAVVNRANAALIPWVWGVNGFASVISSSLCVLLALDFGFRTTAIAAAAIYLISYAILRLGWTQRKAGNSQSSVAAT